MNNRTWLIVNGKWLMAIVRLRRICEGRDERLARPFSVVERPHMTLNQTLSRTMIGFSKSDLQKGILNTKDAEDAKVGNAQREREAGIRNFLQKEAKIAKKEMDLENELTMK